MTTACEAVRVKLGNVLYLTDFSPTSDSALRYVRAITEQFEANILVTHVIEWPEYRFVPPEGWALVENSSEDAARRQLESFDQRLAGIPHELVLRRGEVWQEAAEVIRENDVRLVVAGTHGRTGLRRFLMGSVAEEVVRQAHRPVLTVGPGVSRSTSSGTRVERVVLATDFGDASLGAIPCALSLAEQCGARLSLLHVLKPQGISDQDLKQVKEEAQKKLQSKALRSGSGQSVAEVEVRFGDPTEQICRYAREKRADVLVLGLRRAAEHVGIATHVSRSTAHAVLCSAPCPVLSVMN